MPPTKSPCIKCDQQVKEQEKQGSISCCVCERWIHSKCINIDKGLLAHFMNSHKTLGRHSWGCDGCTSGFYELTIRVGAVKEELRAVKKTVDENTSKIDKVTDRVDKVEKQAAKDRVDLKQDKADIIKEASKAWSLELKDRDSKKDNIVIYGLPEPPLSLKSGIERKNSDATALTTLLTEIKVAFNSDADTRFMVRTGELNERVTAKPRPLLVGLRTSELREQVFAGARNLKESRIFSKISIAPDLTKQQRNEDKELMDEADRKNSEMTEEEALNWEFRCIGRRGQRTLSRFKINPNYPRRQKRAGRVMGALVTGSNLEPLGTLPRDRPDQSPRPSTSHESDHQSSTEEEPLVPDHPGLRDASSASESSEEEQDMTTTRAKKQKKKRNRSGTNSPQNKTKKKK